MGGGGRGRERARERERERERERVSVSERVGYHYSLTVPTVSAIPSNCHSPSSTHSLRKHVLIVLLNKPLLFVLLKFLLLFDSSNEMRIVYFCINIFFTLDFL